MEAKGCNLRDLLQEWQKGGMKGFGGFELTPGSSLGKRGE